MTVEREGSGVYIISGNTISCMQVMYVTILSSTPQYPRGSHVLPVEAFQVSYWDQKLLMSFISQSR